MNPLLVKQISCKRCQKRKIKCSRTQPCQNCAAARVPCEFRHGGSRKYPFSREYVESLEHRVAALERFLARLKVAGPGEARDAMMHHVDMVVQDHYAAPGRHDDASEGEEDPRIEVGDDETRYNEGDEKEDGRKAILLPGDGESGSLTYHGPTSIYSGALAAPISNPTDSSNVPDTLPPSPSQYRIRDTSSRRMIECIALFFHWQYPQFMFIDREAFILDLDPSHPRHFGGQFCSPALVRAVCAVGALMSNDPDTRASAAEFASSAWDELLPGAASVGGVSDRGPQRRELAIPPHTTSVQALLCCAFYEIGRGELSKGWLYSGMAFRMGQDLGFQRDPDTWVRRNETAKDDREKEYRRRIYWGCYISDKFFSLFLGRPGIMHEADADVRPSKPLPQDNMFNSWVCAHGLAHLQDPIPLVPRLTLVFNKQIEIGTIIREALALVYTPARHQQRQQAARKEWTAIALNEINAKLSRFRETLPSEMRLREWSSVSEPVQPHLAALHMLHHGALISLNRPFIGVFDQARGSSTGGGGGGGSNSSAQAPPPTGNPEDATSPAAVCLRSVERMVLILKRFRHQHGLRNAPLSFVHGVVTAVNAVLSLSGRRRRASGADGQQHVAVGEDEDEETTGGGDSSSADSSYLVELESALREMSPTWAIAGVMLARLRQRLLGLSSERSDDEQNQQGREGGRHGPAYFCGAAVQDAPAPTDDVPLLQDLDWSSGSMDLGALGDIDTMGLEDGDTMIFIPELASVMGTELDTTSGMWTAGQFLDGNAPAAYHDDGDGAMW